jgi:sugar phosphate isomerase/epimerase
MPNPNLSFSVFTKPWRTQSLAELGQFIKTLGFDGLEFPLRDGYQVEPASAAKELPRLVKSMSESGLKVTSVASGTEEKIFAACADAGIPLIRIMVRADLKAGYLKSIERQKRELDAVIPLCEKYRIKVGIQHHYGPGVNNSMELRELVAPYDPRYVGAIWDAAHSALAGEEPEQGLDIVWSHLCMVNLKNAFYKRVNGPEAENAEWKRHFTSGNQGLASWPRVTNYLKERGYQGVICLTAEYSDETQTDRLIAADLQYAKSLF